MALGYAPSVLLGLEEYAKENNPAKKLTPVGFWEALNDPENYSPEIINASGMDGHVNGSGVSGNGIVRVKYLNRTTASDAINNRNCDNGVHIPYKEKDVTLSIQKSIKIGFSRVEAKKYMKDASNIQNAGFTPLMKAFNERILVSLNGVRQAVNNALLSEMSNNWSPKSSTEGKAAKSVTLLGTNATGSTETEAAILSGWNQIMYDYENAELSGTPLVVGFGNFARFANSLGVGAVNMNGIDIEKVYKANFFKFYKDLAVSSPWGGENRIGVFAPGVVHAITFNEHEGDFLTSGDEGNAVDADYFTIPDPILENVKWDAKMVFDKCLDLYTLEVFINAGLDVQPSDVYKSTDRNYYSGQGSVTGAFLYNAVKA